MDKLVRSGNGSDQSELDALKIPLSLSKSVLPVIGLLKSDTFGEENGRLSGIMAHIENCMALRRISVVFHKIDGYILWLMQHNADSIEQTDEDEAIYIKEVFEDLPELLRSQTGEVLTLVSGSSFTPIRNLKSVYRKGIVMLERFRGESGTRIIGEGIGDTESNEKDYPSAEELNVLLTLLKNGNRKDLLGTLSKEMSFMQCIEDLCQVVPMPAVTAIEFLISEAQKLCGIYNENYDYLVKELYISNHAVSGAQWLAAAINALDKLMMERSKTKISNENSLIQWINNYINAHYMEDISLSLLVNKVNYNPSYLSRLYKKQTGNSIVTYINERRIDKAKHMLIETALKVTDISTKCGFYSTKHFNLVFKKTTGLSANTYRQRKT